MAETKPSARQSRVYVSNRAGHLQVASVAVALGSSKREMACRRCLSLWAAPRVMQCVTNSC